MTNLIYYTGLFELWRRWRLRGRKGIVILMYHNVGNSRFKNPLNCVSERNFEMHLRYVMRRYRVLSLEHAVQLLERGETLPQGGIVITFDDGYQDNYEIAFPLLKRYGCTATIFVATEPVETGRALWQSRLFCWLITTTRPSFRLTESEQVLPLGSPQERISAYWKINFRLRRLDNAQRGTLLSEIGSHLGFPPDRDPRDVVPMLTWTQLLEMTRGGISVGSHTVTHPMLTSLTPREALAELMDSKRILDIRLKRPVTLFAYPFGLEEHFDQETRRLVEEAGYRAACSAIDGLNVHTTDPLALRRMYVPDIPIAVFAQKLLQRF